MLIFEWAYFRDFTVCRLHILKVKGYFVLGVKNVVTFGHDDEIKTLLSPHTGQFLSMSNDKWIRMWNVKNHSVTWNYFTVVRKCLGVPLIFY